MAMPAAWHRPTASWHLLDGPIQLDEAPSQALLELLVDPQTCGPLLLACPETTADSLMVEGPGSRSATQQPTMAEAFGAVVTYISSCFGLLLQQLELAVQLLQRPAAGQPQLVGQG